MAECFREPCVQNREIVVGLKTCHGDVLRNVLPPQDREGICSTFQVDLTTEFFFFLKNVWPYRWVLTSASIFNVW